MEIFHFYLNWCVKCISHIPLRYHCVDMTGCCMNCEYTIYVWIPPQHLQIYFTQKHPGTLPRLVTRPRDNHLTTWRGVTSRVTAVTQPAVMSCLDRVTMLHHQTMSHSRTLQRFILETLKTILTQHSWWTVWLCSYLLLLWLSCDSGDQEAVYFSFIDACCVLPVLAELPALWVSREQT